MKPTWNYLSVHKLEKCSSNTYINGISGALDGEKNSIYVQSTALSFTVTQVWCGRFCRGKTDATVFLFQSVKINYTEGKNAALVP
jgi:hypothetical protein